MLSQEPKSTTEKPGEDAPRATRRAMRRILRAAFLSLLVVLSLLVLVAGSLVYSLTGEGFGPTWLRDRLEARLEDRVPPGAQVELGSIRAYWEAGSGLVLEAGDVDFSFGPALHIKAKTMAVSSSLRDWRETWIKPRHVRISQVEVSLQLPESAAQAQPRAELIRQFARSFAEGVVEADVTLRKLGFEDFEVENIKLELPRSDLPPLTGQISDFTWQPLGEERSKLWLQASAAGAFWSLTVERTRESGADIVELNLDDLPLATLVPTLANPQTQQSYAGRLQLHARFKAGVDDVQLLGEIGLTPGPVTIDDDSSFYLNDARFAFTLPPKGDEILFKRAYVASSAGLFGLAVALDLNDVDEPVEVRARMPSGVVFAPGGVREQVRGEFDVTFDPARGSVSIDRFSVANPAGNISVVGGWHPDGASPGLALAVSISEMPSSLFVALWPGFLAPGVLHWLQDNLKEGVVGPVELQVALPPDHIGPEGKDKVLPKYGLSGDVPFHSGRFTPAPDLPDFVNAKGSVRLADATATIALDSADVAVPNYPALSAAGSLLVIPDLGGKDAVGDLTLRLIGPAGALAALSNTGPLDVAKSKGISPDDLSGEAELSLVAAVPLKKEASLLSVEPKFELVLRGFSSKAQIEGHSVADADLTLSGVPDAYRVAGKARLDGIEANIDMTGGGTGKSDTDVALVLDKAARDRLGIDLEDYLSGPVIASISAEDDGTQLISLDLTKARVRLAPISWEKGAGVAASAEFRVKTSTSGRAVEGLSLKGEGFHASGSLKLTSDGKLDSLDLYDVALRPGDDFAVKANVTGGDTRISVSGSQLDARGLIRSLKSAKKGAVAGMAPIHLDIALDRVKGENDVTAFGIKGAAEIAGGRLHGLNLSGVLGEAAGGAFNWRITENSKLREQVLDAADGGAVLRFVDLYARVRDGLLTLVMRGPSGGDSVSGEAWLRDFRVVEEAALAEAVRPATRKRDQPGSQRAREQITEEVDTSNMTFTKLRVPFRMEKGVIAIDEAYLRGPMLGATASGTINVTDEKIALSGTFIPAFGINNMAGTIPIFGQILGGGQNEGLVGVTFKLFGNLDNPSLKMNLMSAIAPGIFRKIFEYR